MMTTQVVKGRVTQEKIRIQETINVTVVAETLQIVVETLTEEIEIHIVVETPTEEIEIQIDHIKALITTDQTKSTAIETEKNTGVREYIKWCPIT